MDTTYLDLASDILYAVDNGYVDIDVVDLFSVIKRRGGSTITPDLNAFVDALVTVSTMGVVQ